MNKVRWQQLSLALLLLTSLCISGCQTLEEQIVHDELFTYEMPFDKVYLNVLEVVNRSAMWRLHGTDKHVGLIMARKKDFMHDTIVTIVIKRIAKRKTSVELAPDSQTVLGVETLLKEIDQSLMR